MTFQSIQGIGVLGVVFSVVVTVAQLYALYLFIKAAKIYINKNSEFDDSNPNNKINNN